MADLGTLGGAQSGAMGINEIGQVVGWAFGIRGDSCAFVWDSTTGMRELPGDFSSARAINNQGQIVGWTSTCGGCQGRAAMWEDGALTDLGPGYALAINNLGQVVGYIWGRDPMGQDYNRAVLWEGGTMTDLNTLLSDGSGWTLIGAEGINDAGQIVGYGTSPDGFTHGYLLTPDESPHIPGRFRNNVLFAQLVHQPQSVVQAAVSIPMDQPNQEAPIATIVGALVRGRAPSITSPVVTAHHGQDAVFAGWSDPLVEPLSVGLLG